MKENLLHCNFTNENCVKRHQGIWARMENIKPGEELSFPIKHTRSVRVYASDLRRIKKITLSTKTDLKADIVKVKRTE